MKILTKLLHKVGLYDKFDLIDAYKSGAKSEQMKMYALSQGDLYLINRKKHDKTK